MRHKALIALACVLVFGAFWVAAMRFNVLPGVLVFAMLGMNNIAAGGTRLFLRGLGAHALGLALGVLACGFGFSPMSTMTTIIASSAGRTIYPGAGLSIMVSGAAATATALALECSDGTLIASWPVALLTDLNPVGAFASTAVTRGAALGRGCPASAALMLSNVGTNVTTTTHVYTNVPYTVQ